MHLPVRQTDPRCGNQVGSVISLTSNFITGGALVALLSPFSFGQGVLAVAVGVLLHTQWSGFRASVLTEFAQVVAMLGADLDGATLSARDGVPCPSG